MGAKIQYRLGIILVSLAIITLLSNSIINTLNKYYEKILVTNYFNTQVKEINLEENKDDYIGILKIPKIKLEKGFYDIESSKNNVNQNIEILSSSTMPNEENSLLAIAGHSGNSNRAFFTDLNLLTLNDEIFIYYNNSRYTYKVKDIYNTSRNGIIDIYKEDGNYLVLTTCNENNKKKQMIIIAELI